MNSFRIDKLLSADEVAELLGVKKSTIYQWTHRDYIPYVKLGRLIRFNKSQVLRWIDKKSTQGRHDQTPRI